MNLAGMSVLVAAGELVARVSHLSAVFLLFSELCNGISMLFLESDVPFGGSVLT